MSLKCLSRELKWECWGRWECWGWKDCRGNGELLNGRCLGDWRYRGYVRNVSDISLRIRQNMMDVLIRVLTGGKWRMLNNSR